MKRLFFLLGFVALLTTTGVFTSCKQEAPQDFTVGDVDSTSTVTPTDATGGNSYITITTTKDDGSVETVVSQTTTHAANITALQADTTLAQTMIDKYTARKAAALVTKNAADEAFHDDSLRLVHWTTRKAQSVTAITTVGGY